MRTAFFLFLFVVGMPLFAQEELHRLISPYQKSIVQLEYDFEVYSPVREKSSSRKGVALYTPDNQFRITLGRYLWVSNGSTIWQYSKQREQVTIYRHGRAPFEMPQSLFAFLKATTFTISAGKNPQQKIARWKASPGATHKGYTQATIYYTTTPKRIQKIELWDQEGNRYTYRLLKEQFLKQTNRGQFTFAIPEGVEVLEK